MRQRAIEPILRGLEHCRRRPEQRFRPRSAGVDRRRKVSGEKVRLQLCASSSRTRRTPDWGCRARRRSVSGLGVFLMIQAAERRSQPTQGEDQAELRSAELDDQAETHPLGKREAVLAFRLHFREWVPCRETNRDELIPTVRSKSEVADSIRERRTRAARVRVRWRRASPTGERSNPCSSRFELGSASSLVSRPGRSQAGRTESHPCNC